MTPGTAKTPTADREERRAKLEHDRRLVPGREDAHALHSPGEPAEDGGTSAHARKEGRREHRSTLARRIL